MTIRLIVVGKTDIGYIQQGIDDYASRLKHYTTFEMVVIPSIKNAASLSPDELKAREGEQILKHLDRADCTILLDEHGREFTSVGMAEYLQRHLNAGVRTMAFVIGGAYGFSPAVYAAATARLSLSQMTFNHQMVRLFFIEQLYRAHTILRHEKYHNG